MSYSLLSLSSFNHTQLTTTTIETTSHTFYLNHESHSLSQLLLLLTSCSPEVSVKTSVHEVIGEPSIQEVYDSEWLQL